MFWDITEHHQFRNHYTITSRKKKVMQNVLHYITRNLIPREIYYVMIWGGFGQETHQNLLDPCRWLGHPGTSKHTHTHTHLLICPVFPTGCNPKSSQKNYSFSKSCRKKMIFQQNAIFPAAVSAQMHFSGKDLVLGVFQATFWTLDTFKKKNWENWSFKRQGTLEKEALYFGL